jgi:protein TonB
MTQNEILHANLLDIVFENRNKNYGAYALRKFYPGRLTKSLAVSIGLVLFLFVLTLFAKRKDIVDVFKSGDTVEISKIDLPKPIEIEKPRPVTPDKVATVKLVSSFIISNRTEFPPEEDIIKSQIGTENIQGKPPTEILPAGQSIITAETKPAVEKNEPPAGITSEAAFPGGKEKFAEFLKTRLTSPDDLEPGQKLKVLVRFKVDVDGSISQIEVLESGGVRFDNEVMRVLKKMPKWSPALQNGIKVSSYFIQVVTFVGEEP